MLQKFLLDRLTAIYIYIYRRFHVHFTGEQYAKLINEKYRNKEPKATKVILDSLKSPSNDEEVDYATDSSIDDTATWR